MTKRRTLTRAMRLNIWQAHDGRCHICELKIQPGEDWEVEHIIPIALTVAQSLDRPDNLAPAHVDCHAGKTKVDMFVIAKVKRVAAKHAGIKKRSQWRSKYKRKVNGRTVLRGGI